MNTEQPKIKGSDPLPPYLTRGANFEIHGRSELGVLRQPIVRRIGRVLAYVGSELPQTRHRPNNAPLFRSIISTTENPSARQTRRVASFAASLGITLLLAGC